MFVVDSYKQKYATYIDMPDREFFIKAVEFARENVDAIKHIVDEKGLEFVKSHSPIAFISKLSKQLDIECEVPRKALNDSRARRAFIMGDVDLGEDDWGTYFDMRNNLVKLALHRCLCTQPCHIQTNLDLDLFFCLNERLIRSNTTKRLSGFTTLSVAK